MTVANPAALGALFDLGDVRGSLDGLGTDGIAVTGNEADKQGLKPGDQAELTFADGQKEITVRAVCGRSELTGDYVITRAAWMVYGSGDTAVRALDGAGWSCRTALGGRTELLVQDGQPPPVLVLVDLAGGETAAEQRDRGVAGGPGAAVRA